MKTLDWLRKTLTALCLVGFTQLASAGVISFDPTPALGDVGDSIFVDLVWTGEADEYIGAWDVEIMFNSAVADFTDVVFDPDNGLDTLFGLFWQGPTAGGIFALGVSLDPDPILIARQNSLGNTFRLATLEFTGISEGQTNLTYGRTTFGDEEGLRITPTLVNGQICVGPAGCRDVPEPISIALFGIGLAGLGWSRRKRV